MLVASSSKICPSVPLNCVHVYICDYPPLFFVNEPVMFAHLFSLLRLHVERRTGKWIYTGFLLFYLSLRLR